MLKFRMVVASRSRQDITFAIYEFEQTARLDFPESTVICTKKPIKHGRIQLDKILDVSFSRINSSLHMYIIDDVFLNEYIFSVDIDTPELADKGENIGFRLADTYKHASICSPRSSRHIIRYKDSLLLTCSLKENQSVTEFVLVYQKNGINLDEEDSINPVQILQPSPLNLVMSFFLGIFFDPDTQTDLMVLSDPKSFVAVYQLNTSSDLDIRAHKRDFEKALRLSFSN